ncbi:AAA family ATPase [Candidatus Bathyarchaeota archaeon]|nr:AAA family ATPase [Candidatus Bathyarchaeota archaeon]
MIESIEMVNWKAFDVKSVEFSGGLNIISGENATGKSSIVNGLLFGFFGMEAFPDLRKSQAVELKKNPEEDARVIITFLGSDGSRLVLERSIINKREHVQLRDNQFTDITSDQAQVWPHVEHLIPCDIDYFKKCVFIGESDIFTFFDNPHSATMNEIDLSTRLDKLKKYQDAVSDLLKSKDKDYREKRDRIKSSKKNDTAQFESVNKEIEKAKQRLPAVEADINSLDDRKSKLEELIKECNEKSQLLDDIPDIEQEIKEYQDLLGKVQSELEGLGFPVARGSSMERKINKVLQEKRHERDQLDESLEDLKVKITTSEAFQKQRMKQKKEIQSAGSTCPLCEQPLDPSHVDEIVKEIEDSINEAKNQQEKHEKALSKVKREREEVNNTLVHLETLENKVQQALGGEQEAKQKLNEVKARAGDPGAFIDHLISRSPQEVNLAGVDRNNLQGCISILQKALAECSATSINKQTEKAKLEAKIEGFESTKAFQVERLETQAAHLAHQVFLLEGYLKNLENTLKTFRQRTINQVKVDIKEFWGKFNTSDLIFSWNKKDQVELTIQGEPRDPLLLSESQKLELYMALHLALLDHVSTSKLLILDEPFHSLSPSNKRVLLEILGGALEGEITTQIICTSLQPLAQLPVMDSIDALKPIHEIKLS